ncbi:MAG: adenylate/guanylate cyclase domain-containing protein [Pseudomonadota bacterium]
MSRRIAPDVNLKTIVELARSTLIAAGFTLFAWLSVAALDLSGRLKQTDLAAGDVIASLFDRPVASGEIIVVAIDTPSFQYFNTPWPWPRRVYADLLRAADEAGARAVIFDIVFDAETTDDPAFASAISAFGPVVLAAERSVLSTPQGLILTEAHPARRLKDAASAIGFATLPLDGDGRLRRMPAENDALGYAAAEVVSGVSVPTTAPTYIRYRTPAAPTRISYYQALDPQNRLPDGLLEDKILLVGLALDANPTGTAVGDAVLLPNYAGGTAPRPGVEAQAAVLTTALAGDALLPAPAWLTGFALFCALCGSAILLAVMDRSLWMGLGGYAALVSGVFAVFWLARAAGHVAEPGGLFTGLIAVAAGQTAIIGGFALAARQRLAAGFSRYVSPDIMRQILNAPQPPELGGEDREVSVIVTDLEGFTALMDRLPPAEGAELLRDYLDRLSAVILEHGGLIDQFIGDSVIALFNAPLDQSDHAARAVACVLALDEVAEAFRAERAHGGIDLGATRIGAATGRAVVGNFGARERFHYTAMGDVVNTASRLESANKAGGTRILISDVLYAAAGAPSGFGEVIQVELRGKPDPVLARPGG